MPVTTTPKSTPSGLPAGSVSPTRTLGPPAVVQQTWIQNLVASLKKAGVPDDTANQVAQEQSQQQIHLHAYVGFVDAITTVPGAQTTVFVTALDPYINPAYPSLYQFDFPPNDPKLLPELTRAQNHPHLLVRLGVDDTDPNNMKMLGVEVGWMDDQRPTKA
jgi:hypothetical protein